MTSESTSKSYGCTCAPYPEIDLTKTYRYFIGKEQVDADERNEKWLLETRAKVSEACQQYGCFHVSIDVSSCSSFEILPSLQGSRNDALEGAIEELFSHDFLRQSAAESSSLQGGGAQKREGAAAPESFDARVPSPTCSQSKECKLSSVNATYRGRSSESGDGDSKAAKSEPKQSWEFRRCRASASAREPEHRPVVSWVDDLHSVAVCILRILNLPPIFLQEKSCSCCAAATAVPSSSSQCCVDLLRVFRYDTVEPQEQVTNPGSSPHSDWGAMTIVWQDTVGGLQMHCHSHNTWSDVVVPTHNNNDRVIHFFVHVGDFLSLSTAFPICGGISRWPSPRHRVLCPIKSEKRDKRVSLVYFAYPPPGITLNDAREAFQKSSASKLHFGDVPRGTNKKVGHDVKETSLNIPFDSYSLLHNQSAKGDSKSLSDADVKKMRATDCKRYYEAILDVPFDHLMKEKWNQVQRG